jgi:dimethylargininase
MNFSHAITRKPGNSFPFGITTAALGKPDLELALTQHNQYCTALAKLGLQVDVLPVLELFPDSVFVEDVAIVEPDFAVLTRPGAIPRREEAQEMLPELQKYFKRIYQIEDNATLDGGDICKADEIYYIGLSERTNLEGAQQLAAILNLFGYRSFLIDIRPLEGVLHLKSAVNYLGDRTMLLDPRMANLNEFTDFNRLIVPIEEAYAANCLRINDSVLVPFGFPQTLELVTNAGFDALLLDVSEYRKMDGGLSCLSLRW